jgi:bifunctional hydroxylase/dehydrase
VDVVTAQAADLDGAADDPLAGTFALLVRPDGHLVWGAPDGGEAEIVTALTRWFGAPADGTPAPRP